MLFQSVAFLLVSFSCSVHSWYNCNDVDFCARNRNKATGRGKYAVDMSNLDLTTFNHVGTELVNQGTNKRFSLELTALSGDVYRVVINDKENPRHQVEDALSPTLTRSDAKKSSERATRNTITVYSENSKAIIQTNPFTIEFYHGDTLVAQVNAGGQLVFEEEEPEVAVGIDVLFPGAKEAYGLPSHPDNIALRDTVQSVPYRLYNIDRASYGEYETQALYGSVPVLYAHSPERSSGFFWLNSAQTFVDVERRSDGVKAFFLSESGALDFFVLTGPTFKDAVKQYASVTGKLKKTFSSFNQIHNGNFYLIINISNLK